MSVKHAQHNVMASTQMYLKIAEIRDNVVVMKDGSMRAVLKTSSVNFDLKSKEEQESIIYGYQQFLNSLEFPVQFLIKSRKLNIEEYLDMLRGKAQEQKNELIRKQTYEYIEYIARLVDIADIMRKDFYVIVPFEPLRAKTRTPMDVVSDMLTPQDTVEKIKKRHKEFDSLRSRVQQRVNVVKGSLRSCQVQSQQLDTQALIELFYESYNPIIAYEEKVDDINTMNLDQDSRLTRE